jgi:hypothetical protein
MARASIKTVAAFTPRLAMTQYITSSQWISDAGDLKQSTVRKFCYHCRSHHEQTAMRRVVTAVGVRWRCIASIAAARQSREIREQFGRETTAANRVDSRRRGQYLNQHRQLPGQ